MVLKEVDALFAMHGVSNGHCWVSDPILTRKRKCDTFHMCMRRVRMCRCKMQLGEMVCSMCHMHISGSV